MTKTRKQQIDKAQMEVAMALHCIGFLIPDGKLDEGLAQSKRIEQAVLELGKLAEEVDEESKE